MEEKSKQIQNMFNNIAPKYDFLNRLLSFRRDVYWRKKSISLMNISGDIKILDLACGTGDMTVELKQNYPDSEIVDSDFSINMLNIAKQKVGDTPLIAGDAHYLPFKNNSFDRIMIAFGFRNVTNKPLGLSEMYRILKPNGILCILEFSQPDGKFFSSVYRFYFTRILPAIGGVVSGNRKAYEYLPDSVYNFPKKNEYRKMILDAGFKDVNFNFMTFGICNAAICTKGGY
ncbi:MAG: bifunctional demethylmenaquinone methyltransferase/2-methoxy-6-polyprenyl-1,4-benzoquinol methylase UbiE [Calditerrivibrio sp.]|nr:bifunctional demethylmenaquinone methyltransferase/2-methoxy-6-polyprenyl-1,4-benzoquinol methylase UbiE [Calditerrivibrio sp.]MCA1933081.1 bifunctional demethylmenaquinone methyltransferase/2-methoxy-6-polyprenyl-1,4-benzoquinol methylase UbiE [Calditerrivibrio sp.]MCA1980247.1 bifunctional demethylmenaquinone methyltransferase/2-methoxy-6-polyprenyl-1,4-benzoquinol methylase UbiE [Calditerrivibrio sp.]